MGVGCQRHAPTALPQRETRYPLYRRMGGPKYRYGRVRKILSTLQAFEHSNRPDRIKSLYPLRHRGPQNPPCPRHFTPLSWRTSPAYPKCSQSAVGHRDVTEVRRLTLLRSRVSKRTTFRRLLHQRFILHMSRPLMNCAPNTLSRGTHISAICYHIS